jgi:hypothetical protein
MNRRGNVLINSCRTAGLALLLAIAAAATAQERQLTVTLLGPTGV